MAKWALFILALSMILASSFVYVEPAYAKDAAITLKHRVVVNEFGYVVATDTIQLFNNGSAPIPVSTFELGYPKEYSYNVAAVVVEKDEASVSMKVEENATVFTLKSKQNQLQAKGSLNLTVTLYLSKLVKSHGLGKYSAILPLMPSFNTLADRAEASLSFPANVRSDDKIKGFETLVGAIQEYRAAFNNTMLLQPKGQNVSFSIRESDAAFALIDFPKVTREVRISSLGTVMVKETVKLINYGDRELTKLRINPIERELREVTILPPTSPTLGNIMRVKIFENAINLLEDLKTSVDSGERATIEFEYQLTIEKVKFQANFIELVIPLSSIVDGVASTYISRIVVPEGYVIKQGEAQKTGFNVTGKNIELHSAVLVPTATWAMGDSVQLAAMVFVASLIAAVALYKPPVKAETREVSKLLGFVKAVEESLSVGRELLQGFEGRQVGSVGRRELEEGRRSLDEMKVRVNTRLSEVRPSLSTMEEGVQKLFDEVVGLIREVDRASKDLLNLQEQYHTRRVKPDTYSKLSQSHQKRLARLTEQLTEKLRTIERSAPESMD